MISPQFRPLYGGYEHAAERLSGALARRGLEVVVISERRDRSWPASETLEGFEIRRLWCLYRRHMHTGTSLFSFARFLLTNGRRFDVWHVHQYGYHAALSVALGKLLRRPVVLKLTNSEAMGIGSVLGSGLVGRTLEYLHRRVSACIAISEETRSEAISFGIPAGRVRLIPNGLDPDQFLPATAEQRVEARRVLGLDRDRIVLSVGRLSDEKNPLGLLEAWANVTPVLRAGALLALVGDGPQEELVRAKVAELKLGDSVLLAGRRIDVASWYRAADIYVIASHNEGLSNSMIEALAAGLPVISTKVSGSSFLEAGAASGLVVGTGRTEELTRALEELLSNESLRSTLAGNARQSFENHFLLELVAEKSMSLYGDVASSR
ncbi:MAG: glycosyltransferase family 4 protein [Acidobacteriota bacterium]